MTSLADFTKNLRSDPFTHLHCRACGAELGWFALQSGLEMRFSVAEHACPAVTALPLFPDRSVTLHNPDLAFPVGVLRAIREGGRREW